MYYVKQEVLVPPSLVVVDERTTDSHISLSLVQMTTISFDYDYYDCPLFSK